MAFQIHITTLEQAVVCANEKITNHLIKTKEEIDPENYKKIGILNPFLLFLNEIHGNRSSDVMNFCVKVWQRAIDCHQELETKGKLKAFITAANGMLVTVVRVIDALSLLKSLLRQLALKSDYREIKETKDWIALIDLVAEHTRDANEMLSNVDNLMHKTRQKIHDIKIPSIRILEVARMDVDEDLVYITSEKNFLPKVNDGVENEDLDEENSVRKSSSLELGEIVENEEVSVSSSNETSNDSQPLPTTTSISQQPLSCPLPSITSALPSLTYPTMSTLPMQAQLIPTIQLDAFGNQSIVYQLAYQQINPTTLTSQTIPNSLETPLAGIVIPGYNANSIQQNNHQASPTQNATSQSQDVSDTSSNSNDQVSVQTPSAEKEKEEEVIVVKPDSDNETQKIKEEPKDDDENVSKIIETGEITFKQEPEWNEKDD